MKIAIASDHTALEMKAQLKAHLRDRGFEVREFGAETSERVDYCDYAFRAGEAVAAGECERGILLCGTGVGMAISANKVKGIRAVVCSEPYSARLSREHNDANILALGARVVGIELARMIVDVWLDTAFEGGRHAGRVDKIAAYEQQQRQPEPLNA